MLVSQTQLDFPNKKGWPRPGPGRPKTVGCVMHRSRGVVSKHEPIHITLRVRSDVPNLRKGRFIRSFRQTLAQCSSRDGFRVAHYSVQSNHVHCLVEADNARQLGCGMKSLGARFARAVNRVFRRTGKVLKERYHMHVLKTPREVRNALAYVLLNARKHFQQRRRVAPPPRIDPLSSGHWFDGWKNATADPPDPFREVAKPRTWLLAKGWRKHRLIRVEEIPGCV